MEKLFEGVGTALLTMPPGLAAVVILALAVMALVYAWRKAGEEARRERTAADTARAETSGAHTAHILAELKSIGDNVEQIKTDMKVLMDRGRK